MALFTNFLPLGGLAQVSAQLVEGAPQDFELLCRFFCRPGEREAVEPLARFMFSSYITVPVYTAFYRSAWLRRSDRSDDRGLAIRRPRRRRRGGAWKLIEEMFIFSDLPSR